MGYPLQKTLKLSQGEQVITLLFRICLQRNATMIPWAFNIKAYEAIEAFQGKHIINTHIYVRDLKQKGMGIMYQKVTCRKTKTLSILHILSCNNFLAMTSYQIFNKMHQNNKAMHNNHM
jgi:hypothetical protein